MPQTRERVAKEVAAKLNEFETRLDQAIAAGGDLIAIMPLARLEAKVAASVGHNVMAGTAQALSGLIGARSNIVAVHDGLARLSDDLGLRVVAGGDLWKLPAIVEFPLVANDRQAA